MLLKVTVTTADDNLAKKLEESINRVFIGKAEAVENLQRVVDMEEMYQDGYAIYYLARAYESSEDTEKAVPLFRKFAEAYPGTVRANYCNQALTRLGQPAVEQQQSNQPQQPQEPQGPQENQPQDPQPPA